MSKGKFILTDISIARCKPYPIRDRNTGSVLRMSEETLEVGIEYIGHGKTTEITTEELVNKLNELIKQL